MEVDVEVDVAVAVAEFEADADVDVAVVNRLASVACSCIWIGCAHIVIGPETCVLSSDTWRTVTMVELSDGSMLVHPAYVESTPMEIVRYSKLLWIC